MIDSDPPLHLPLSPAPAHQPKIELIEHTLATDRLLRDQLLDRRVSLDRILRLEETQIIRERELRESHRFGEVRQHIDVALAARGRDELRQEIARLRDLRYRGAELAESRQLNRVLVFLAALSATVGGANLLSPIRDALARFTWVQPLGAFKTEILTWILAFGVPSGLAFVAIIAVRLLRGVHWAKAG